MRYVFGIGNRRADEMNVALAGLGFLFFTFGWLNVIHPENGLIRNFVDPRTWQRNPTRAAVRQRRYVRYTGYGFAALGLLMMAGGLLL